MISDDILELLAEDIVSHGIIAQCLSQSTSDDAPHATVRSVLEELLESGNVEIGTAKLARPDYVEFLAWTGSVADRVHRAIEAVQVASESDKEFAYWLCLREHVDCFEGEHR